MAKKTYDYLYKLLLIGESGVGKTSLLFRYVEDTFSHTFIATIGIDFKIKTIILDGKKIKLQIWDTAGQERFHTITTGYYRGAMGIMLVYDVTDKKTFHHVEKWLNTIRNHASENVQKMLVGNKADADDIRMVTTDAGRAMARENGLRFFETSAKTGENVEEAFHGLTSDIFRNLSMSEPSNYQLGRSPGHSSSNVTIDPSKYSYSSQSVVTRCCSSGTSHNY